LCHLSQSERKGHPLSLSAHTHTLRFAFLVKSHSGFTHDLGCITSSLCNIHIDRRSAKHSFCTLCILLFFCIFLLYIGFLKKNLILQENNMSIKERRCSDFLSRCCLFVKLHISGEEHFFLDDTLHLYKCSYTSKTTSLQLNTTANTAEFN